MRQYSQERKESVIRKMMAPDSRSISSLSKEEGIPEGTLHGWRNKARCQGLLLPDGSNNLSGWSSTDKFSAVLESASFNEKKLAEYCRKKGIQPDMLRQWRKACACANDWDEEQNRLLKTDRQDSQRRIKELERELRRKDKALAETAALLVLRKKARAIWGEEEGI